MRLAYILLLSPLLSLAQQKQHSSTQLSPVNYHLSSPHPQPLTLGDKLPSFMCTQLSTQNSPLTIISFFATWCSVCIGEVPKLDSLQKQFGKELKIILVTYEEPSKLSELRSKNKRFASSNLPVITGDTVLSKYFPHHSVPHTVWLSANGSVLAITGAQELTPANVRVCLQNNSINLPLKLDRTDINPKLSLLSQPGIGLVAHSLLANSIEGAGTTLGSIRDTVAQTQRITCINTSLLGLLEAALGQTFSNRWQLGFTDSLVAPSAKSFSFFNTPWCYEYCLPLSLSKATVKQWILQDLSRCFNISIAFQKQNTACWALIKTGTDSLLKSKGGKAASTLFAKDSAVKYLCNQPITRLLKALNYSTPGNLVPIVLDETGISYNIDISLTTPNLQNLSVLNDLLIPYGLKLIPVTREIEFLVITKNNPTQ